MSELDDVTNWEGIYTNPAQPDLLGQAIDEAELLCTPKRVDSSWFAASDSTPDQHVPVKPLAKEDTFTQRASTPWKSPTSTTPPAVTTTLLDDSLNTDFTNLGPTDETTPLRIRRIHTEPAPPPNRQLTTISHITTQTLDRIDEPMGHEKQMGACLCAMFASGPASYMTTLLDLFLFLLVSQ